jgi:hypothetical protein
MEVTEEVRRTAATISTLALAGLQTTVATAEPETRTGRDDLIQADLFQRPPLQHETRRKHGATKERSKGRKSGRRHAVDIPPQLEAIAQCESHGDPHAISSSGRYRGKYQFNYATWASLGGKGDPAAAPEAEQDRRAAILYARSGPGQWPVCG